MIKQRTSATYVSLYCSGRSQLVYLIRTYTRSEGSLSFGVTGHLDFSEPSVISTTGITEPVDEIFGVTFFRDSDCGSTRLRRKQTTLQWHLREVMQIHISSNGESCYLIKQNVLQVCEGDPRGKGQMEFCVWERATEFVPRGRLGRYFTQAPHSPVQILVRWAECGKVEKTID
jgi:hypothetical protein